MVMGGRILIVDDDRSSVLLLEEYLADTATEMRSVTDSRLAEQVIDDFHPDLVLLDLHMPHLDGREVLRRLQVERSQQVFVPVIVLTADVSDVARKSALLLGADDFLTKPLDRSEVILRARNLLHTRQLFVELAETNRRLQRDRKPDFRQGRSID